MEKHTLTIYKLDNIETGTLWKYIEGNTPYRRRTSELNFDYNGDITNERGSEIVILGTVTRVNPGDYRYYEVKTEDSDLIECINAHFKEELDSAPSGSVLLKGVCNPQTYVVSEYRCFTT